MVGATVVLGTVVVGSCVVVTGTVVVGDKVVDETCVVGALVTGTVVGTVVGTCVVGEGTDVDVSVGSTVVIGRVDVNMLEDILLVVDAIAVVVFVGVSLLQATKIKPKAIINIPNSFFIYESLLTIKKYRVSFKHSILYFILLK